MLKKDAEKSVFDAENSGTPPTTPTLPPRDSWFLLLAAYSTLLI